MSRGLRIGHLRTLGYHPATRKETTMAKPAANQIRPPLTLLFGLAIAACTAGVEASEARAEAGRSGRQVYEQTCVKCHATGLENAPRWGDRAAWKPLVEEGQEVLTAHAWVGVRAMPPRGGDPSLSLVEFARAVAYMVRSAGGDWEDPDDEMLEEIREEEEDRIEAMRAGARAAN